MEQSRTTNSQLASEVIRLRERVAQLEAAAYNVYDSEPEKERRLAQVLLEIAPDGIISVNSSQIIQSFNRAAEVAFGYTADEVKGEPLDMLIPDQFVEAHHEHLTEFAESGEVARRMNERGPVLGKRKDGTEFPASVSISNFQVGGEKVLVAVIRDLTEFEQVEESVRRLPLLTDLNPSPIVVFDSEGLIIIGNQAARKLIGESQIMGMPLNVLLGEDHEINAGACIAESDTLTQFANVGEKHFQFTIAGVSRLKVGFVYGTNITELKKAEEELDAFAYTISHNLRAPLRAINGFANILSEDKADDLDSEAQRYLKIITDNVDEMGSLIDGLLAFSRMSRYTLDTQLVDVSALVNHLWRELRVNSDPRHIEFRVYDIPECIADPNLLKEALSNLLSNAIKFTGQENTAVIEVGCETQGQQKVYFVKDNGTGIDMRYSHKLFNVFERLHTSDEFEGTGVGLAIVRNIIERHGGSIWVDGKKGEGTTFYFTLSAE